MKKITYDTKKYNFKEIIEKLFQDKLENLHQNIEILDVNTDQSTVFHKKYYEGVAHGPFFKIYENFVKEIIQPAIEEEILFQAIPTFRVHMKGNLAVGAFHRDSDYSHNSNEINIFLPLTNAYGNNTIWVESEFGKEDFAPMNTNYGEIHIWDGANLKHGNKLNDTELTRVSFDFRVLKKSNYQIDNIKKSFGNETKMEIGGYWKEL
jgi:hypothetical protein